MRHRTSALVGLLPLCVASSAHAGAWTQEKGACYAKAGARLILGDGAYEAQQLRRIRPGVVDFVDVQTPFYAECGVHEQLTLVAFGTPFGYAHAGNDTFYIGPLGVSARFDPIGDQAATRFSLQLDVAYAPPVGDTVLFEEAGSTPRTVYQPALENLYGEVAAQLGRGFSLDRNVQGWANAQLGLRIHSASQMTPALVASGQLGFTFFSWFTAELVVPVYEPVGADVEVTNIAGVGQTRYLGIVLKASAWITSNIGVFTSFGGVVYASSNAASPSLELGIESRFAAWGGG